MTGVAAVETVVSETTSLCISVEAERSFMVSEEVSVTVSLLCTAGSSVAAGASGSDSDSEPDEESDEISDSVVSGSYCDCLRIEWCIRIKILNECCSGLLGSGNSAIINVEVIPQMCGISDIAV